MRRRFGNSPVQIRAKKLIVKVYLRHPLHAKLYLLHRQDANNPVTGFLGSSNLTLAGLAKQGELNVDVLEHDACNKLVDWFEDRWRDRWCIDISKELADIIDESWAGERLVPPYHVYLKMAYHLAQEARAGLSEFRIPRFLANAVRLPGCRRQDRRAPPEQARRRADRRRGRLGQVHDGHRPGQGVRGRLPHRNAHHLPQEPGFDVGRLRPSVRLHAKVLPLSKVLTELPEKTRRYRLVLIDESHNLRNKEGKRWKVIREYIERNDSLTVLLLSATPYNKTYLDLSAQLALFLREDADIGIRPEKLLAELGGEHEFIRRHQCPVRSLAAFEKSEIPMTGAISCACTWCAARAASSCSTTPEKTSAANTCCSADGRKSYFPKRIPKNLSFKINDANPSDPYARFYSDPVVNAINELILPRYGLGNYVAPSPRRRPRPIRPRSSRGCPALARG
jgi:hypothetical protein